MRQDICRSIGLQNNRPSDSTSYGYLDRSFISINRACDAWLKKHCPPIPRKFNGFIKDKQPNPEQASSMTGGIHVPRERKPKWKRPSQKRYKTDEERKEAMRAIVKAHWESLTPEQRAERSAKSNKGRPKSSVPRWKTPEWKEYKNKWCRDRIKSHPLTEAQLLQRREKAKAKYQANREHYRAKANERRRRARETKKTQETAIQEC